MFSAGATKGALDMLTRVMALELGPHQVIKSSLTGWSCLWDSSNTELIVRCLQLEKMNRTLWWTVFPGDLKSIKNINPIINGQLMLCNYGEVDGVADHNAYLWQSWLCTAIIFGADVFIFTLMLLLLIEWTADYRSNELGIVKYDDDDDDNYTCCCCCYYYY